MAIEIQKGDKEVKKKVVWLLMSCLMVVAVLLASCAPAVEEEEEVTAPEEEVVEEEVAPAPETVTFPDNNLEAAIRNAISKPEGPILPTDLEGLTSLEVGNAGITDLTGLEHCTNLTNLTLNENQISDTSPLADLTNLTQLRLDGNQISDITPLANLTSVTRLGLWQNQISDISPLVENSGLGAGDKVLLVDNNLDLSEGSEDMENIRALENRGVVVNY